MTAEELHLCRWIVCASGLIYWGGVLVQARRVRKQIGRSPNLKPRDSRERALWLGWLIVIATWIGQPFFINGSGAGPLAFWTPVLHPAAWAAGIALVVLGYAGTLWTYAAMGDAWRIGIKPEEKNSLVRSGPYQWVRHPIYFLQIVMLAGAALLLPTVVSLAILLLHYGCVRIKAGDEETYLTSVHGDAYRDFCRRTGGIFPRPWRRWN